MAEKPQPQNPFGIERHRLGAEAHHAQVLCHITSPARDPLDVTAPTLTVCRLPDRRFAACETDGDDVVVVGDPIAHKDAMTLAMNVVGGHDPVIVNDPKVTHALAVALVGLVAGATLMARDAGRRPMPAAPIVVEFPAARGAG